MLDPRLLRQDATAVARQLARRHFKLDVDAFQTIESQRKALQLEQERLQGERNRRAKEIGQAKSRGLDVADAVAAANDVNAALQAVSEKLEVVAKQMDELLAGIPNLPDASVPDGASEAQNVQVRQHGTLPTFNFAAKDHVELGGAAMDFARAGKIAGSRFVVLRGNLARLQRALIQFMLDVHIHEHGYEEVYVPFIVNADSLFGTGQLPKFEEDLFKLRGDQGYYLASTAEVPVTNLVRDEILNGDELPLKWVCHTPCFRSEAGSYGKDTRGMIRQHQFEKVELVQIVRPDDSWRAHEELTAHAENILKKLQLPFRTVALCGGDLGFAAAKTYDLEVWLPGQQKYREISSCSNFLDFQARRLKARYRNRDGKPELLHTLNGSGLAAGRTLVAILENYQDAGGAIHVPEVLRPYLPGLDRIV